jgi:hypothetical protein
VTGKLVRFVVVTPLLAMSVSQLPPASSTCHSLAPCVLPASGSENALALSVAPLEAMLPTESVGAAGAVLGTEDVVKLWAELQLLQPLLLSR